MLIISSWFVVVLLFSVHCLQRQFWYSRMDKEVTNSSLAVLYGEVVSLVHCAGLCSGDDYCMEFLYSETSRQCIGLHCVNKGSHSYQYVVPTFSRMLYFGKGKLLFTKIFYNHLNHMIYNPLRLVPLFLEFNWVEYSGHYYFYEEENVTWTDAKVLK